MLKQVLVFEEEEAGRGYRFMCDLDSPLGDIHDVLVRLRGDIVDRMIAAQKQDQEAMEQRREQDKQLSCGDSE